MQIIHTDDTSILKGIEQLSSYYSIPDDINIYARKGDKLTVRWEEDNLHITFPFKAAFFRALSLADMMLGRGTREDLSEAVYFDECGVMFDFSRGCIMSVEGLKQYAAYMARMGLNAIYLYTEDTYEIEEYPYFGYMRGRYTKSELRLMDEYCDSIGIELIPHIQTLGHMSKFLMWDEGAQFRDTTEVLHPDDENTFEFIKKAILAVSSCFKTRKIHLGMDEAENLGSGRFYAKNGAVDRKDIFLKHVKRVVDFAVEQGLEPIIYDDTLAKVLSGKNARAENPDIPEAVKSALPEGFVPCYWNYYSEDKEVYKKFLTEYKNICGDVIFWGGIWTWRGSVYDAVMTERLSEPALMACKEVGVRRAIGSIWGNSGDCNYIYTIHGCMYFAEHMYSSKVNPELLKERFEFITHCKYDAFTEMSYYHNDYYNFNQYKSYIERYFGKRYFWADILVGLLDADLKEKAMSGHYEKMAKDYERFLDSTDPWYEYYLYVWQTFDILAKKCFVSENLKDAYDSGNIDFLKRCAYSVLPQLKQDFEENSRLHQKLWLNFNKPFGYEAEDVKFGGMIKRIDTACRRIDAFIKGEIPVIEELEEKRLPHNAGGDRVNYSSIITPKGELR